MRDLRMPQRCVFAVGFLQWLPSRGGCHGAWQRITDLQLSRHKQLSCKHGQEAGGCQDWH